MSKKLTIEYVSQRFKEYGCELLEKEYKNSKVKMKYKCKCGSVSETSFRNFKKGTGCVDCTGRRCFTVKEFIKRARKIYGNKYNYSKVNYKNIFTKVIIICSIHGEFWQTPHQHLRGHSCELCSRKLNAKLRSKSVVDFIKDAKKIHGDKYDYGKVNYKTDKIKIIIVCPDHGEFSQTPRHHLKGCGCPHCLFKNEGKVKNLLLEYFKGWTITSHKRIWEGYKGYNVKRYCDFWLEKNDIKVIVEYDGEQHFKVVRFGGCAQNKAIKNLIRQQKVDRLDAEFCKENNIILHRIRYDEDKEKSIKELISDYNLCIV